MEERSADNTYSGEEFEGDDFVAELSADKGSVFLPPQTPKVNRIVRSHSEATSPPASQKSPSPVKKAVRLQASTQKVKTTRIILKATPRKAAKGPKPEIEDITSKNPKKSIKKPILPRHTGASTDSPQKGKRTLGKLPSLFKGSRLRPSKMFRS
uniref:Beta-glucosidase (EC) n=1 Tax=Ganoderma boninense TaxID=34458 RepID=A0A5K1K7V4_9APHY|nr:Beta-glucosidase (EC [Ganoderma boninense]